MTYILKSCPFCGDGAIISSERICLGHGDYRDFYFVHCINCLAQSKSVWSESS